MLSILKKTHPEEHSVQVEILAVGLGVSVIVGGPRSSDSLTYIVVYLSHLVTCGL